MATLKTFVPANVNISWGGIILEGFSTDSFVTVSRSSDNTTVQVGAAGDVGITKIADRTGTVEITLMQNSVTHRILSAIQTAQDVGDELYRANMTITDPSGSMICKIFNAHIQTPPEVTLGADQNEKTWTFFAERVIYTEAPDGVTPTASEISIINDAISTIKNFAK